MYEFLYLNTVDRMHPTCIYEAKIVSNADALFPSLCLLFVFASTISQSFAIDFHVKEYECEAQKSPVLWSKKDLMDSNSS